MASVKVDVIPETAEIPPADILPVLVLEALIVNGTYIYIKSVNISYIYLRCLYIIHSS